MTEMTMTSSKTINVKPSILELTICIKQLDEKQKKAADMTLESLSSIKDIITEKQSYQKNSWQQTSVTFKRNTYQYIYYENSNNNKDIISQETFNSAPATVQHQYNKKYKTKLLNYSAIIFVSCILDNTDTIVNDFTDILNMISSKEQFSITYKHTLTNEEYKFLYDQLTADCINNGIKDAKELASKVSIFDPDKVNILEIVDNSNINNNMVYKAARRSSNEEEIETIIEPELVQDLFDTNIEISKSLMLKIRFN